MALVLQYKKSLTTQQRQGRFPFTVTETLMYEQAARWRRVQLVGESWMIEVASPGYKAQEPEEVDDWKPAGIIWQWEHLDRTDRPWRGKTTTDGLGEHRDYKLLAQAQGALRQRVQSMLARS